MNSLINEISKFINIFNKPVSDKFTVDFNRIIFFLNDLPQTEQKSSQYFEEVIELNEFFT